jgi:hypothetical protein
MPKGSFSEPEPGANGWEPAAVVRAPDERTSKPVKLAFGAPAEKRFSYYGL